MSSRVLKIKDGRLVKALQFGDGFKLCAVDSQPNDDTVYIEKHRSFNWIAFKFKLNHDNMVKDYFLKWNKQSLELVPPDQLDSDSVEYWFEKHNYGGSEHYGLKTTRQPQKYVCISKKDRRRLFSLSDTMQDLAQVKDEAK
ncbi:G protein-coupled receptor family C group 6 member A [Sarotherodon galilaeus]